ncbi:transcription factor BIM2 isoform X2 [Capsicum annuum]|uniref:transcription factor BIM2 isoform X2 n=1 Tax=Capsicum annuum TaxID=4072 RepID=UPI0007BEE77A|nr:transcription factor BIM2 isoform X2 [Capsicum annuum]
MKSGKGHHGEEEEDEYDVGSNRDATPSSNSTKEGKNSDKANAIRSKHSVTEQRRRSKINERFQTLRNLIPHTDQKRDTASFLSEVIQYVQYLQETVQKYEGSYQPWNSEPTKLMPWRNSHWRAHSFPATPQALRNSTDTGPTYSGRFDENLLTDTSAMQANQRNPLVSHPGGDVSYKSMDQEKELVSRAIATSIPLQASVPVPVQNDSAFSDSLPTPASDECPSTTNALNGQEFVIEGGTISISSPYSPLLLSSFTQALETAGLDLSQATVSVQINLGKQAFKGMSLGPSVAKKILLHLLAINLWRNFRIQTMVKSWTGLKRGSRNRYDYSMSNTKSNQLKFCITSA